MTETIREGVLGEVLERRGMPNTRLADLAGTTKQNVGKLRRKPFLSKTWAERFSPHLAVPAAALMGAEPLPADLIGAGGQLDLQPVVRPLTPDDPIPRGSIVVQEYAMDAAAGGGTEPWVDYEGRATVLAEWMIPRDFLPPEHRNATIAVVRVSGDSMAPGLDNRDRVMVNLSQPFIDADGLYLAWNGMGVVIKRLQAIPGAPPKIKFLSDNPKYEAYTLTAEEVRVYGSVIGKWVWW